MTLMAERCSRDVFFLGHALALHRERYGLTEGEQRRHLGVQAEAWVWLQFCQAPAEPRSKEDLGRICERFGADKEKLGRVVRGGE